MPLSPRDIPWFPHLCFLLTKLLTWLLVTLHHQPWLWRPGMFPKDFWSSLTFTKRQIFLSEWRQICPARLAPRPRILRIPHGPRFLSGRPFEGSFPHPFPSNDLLWSFVVLKLKVFDSGFSLVFHRGVSVSIELPYRCVLPLT